MKEEEKSTLTRRVFLKRTALGGAVVVGGIGLPACGNPVDPTPVIENVTVEDDPTDLPTYGTIRLQLSRAADLALVGGAVTLQLAPITRIDPMRPWKLPATPRLLVVHRAQLGEPDEYIAVDSACPHAGCPLGYAKELDRIACPCHSSQFSAVSGSGIDDCVGKVLHLPAKQNVTPYEARLDPEDRNTLVINLNVINACGELRLPPLVGGKVTVPIAQFPALGQVGGGLVGRPGGAPDSIAIVRVGAGNDASAFTALSAVCTHLACTVVYAKPGETATCGLMPNGGFWCPCHCSQFTSDGSVIGGPAPAPLPRYGVAFDGTTLTITLT